jgi:chromosome segregation ATPase
VKQLKKQYEMAVEARNYTGIQLIDRNDELCILYEKSNIQEQTIKKGEIEIRKREDEIRMLHLELAEVQRQIEVTRKQMPRMPAYAEQILGLQQELAMEREMTEMLCRDLETPSNADRWRQLEGEDPDREQLQAKVQVLEERLNDKKEQLLEKELVLEEVSSLSDKLRRQASEGRADTLALAKRVNEFQARIKETTRKMMATVSELSMYQATAMKLQQEKHDREVELEDAGWRVKNGTAPNEETEHEWYRMERERLRRQEEAMERANRRAQESQMPAQITRTTAEPRPNAYIPDELGIPKPYGGLAPFKPSEPGATMRHIRKPQPKEIEI